jgi:hypothetical protein
MRPMDHRWKKNTNMLPSERRTLQSETSKGNKSLLYDGFAFRIDRVLKSGDISWRCTVKNCKGRIKTDDHSSVIINGNCN